MRIIGVNGILSDGGQSTDQLLAKLQNMGHDTIDIYIPKRTSITARFSNINKADSRRVLEYHQPGDVVVAHSRGALVTWYALQKAVDFSHIFLFSPAMEADVEWPAGPYKVHVICNVDDPALRQGKMLWFSPFGELGITGYKGPLDSRIGNKPVNYPGHSDYFLPSEVQGWADYVDRIIKA